MNKKHILRYALIGIPALVLGLFLVAIIVLNTAAFRNYLRSEIGRQALQRAGARVEIGAIDTHWTHLGADVHDIVVYGGTTPSARGEPPLLRASRLQVGLRFFPLLHGRFELRELILDQPVVDIRIDSQGRSNLPNPPKTGPSRGVDPFFDLEISDCEIHSGEIDYNNAQTPLDAELHDLKFNAAYSLLSSEYKGSLSYASGRISAPQFEPITHSLQLQFTASRSGLSLDPLFVATAASHVSFSARLTGYSSPSIDGTYQGNVSTQEIANALRLSSLPVGNVALKGKLAYQPHPNQPFLAAIYVQGQAGSGKLQFRTARQPVDATSVNADYELKDANLQVQNLVADILGGHARANLEMQRIDAPSPPSRLDASVKAVSLASASNALASPDVKRIPFTGTSDLDLRASWSGPIQNSVAHARLIISSGHQTASTHAIPVDGLIQVDYKGPQNTISFGQSHLQTANTRLLVAGTLSSRRNGNSGLTVMATTADLGETASLATILQNALQTSGQPSRIPALGGSATLTARLTGAARDPRIQGQLSAQNLAVDGTRWRSLALNLQANSSQVAVENGVLAGTQNEQINFNGKVGLQHWALVDASPVQLQASVANMSVDSAEAIARTHYPVTGVLTARVNVSGTKAAPDGKATLTLVKASAWNEPIESLTLNAQSHQGAIHSTVNLQIPAGAVTATVAYTLSTEQYDLQLQGKGIDLEKIAPLQKRGALQGIVDLSASGRGTIHDPQLEAKLAIPRLQTQGQTASDVAAQISVANQRAALELHSVIDQGSVDAKGDVGLTGSRDVNATLDVRALPVAAVAANFFPSQGAKLGGQTELHLTLKGPLQSPAQIEAHLEIPTLNVTYGKAQLGLARPLQADYRGGTLTVTPAQIQGTGTNLTFGGTIPIKSQAAFSLVADGSMDLSIFQQFAPAVRSSGELEIHIHGNGRASQPSMQGQFLIKNGVLSAESLPVGIESLNAEINLSGNRATIANFSGKAGGGTLSARGAVTLGHDANFNLALNADSVRIRYPEGLRSVLSGQINLQGSPAGSSLTGRVLVDSLYFTQQFDLANFAGYFSQDTSGAPPSAFENNMRLSLSVQSSENISLASSKLSMGGSANLNVVGTLAQPVILGRIALSSGEVFFLGKRFQVQSGTIEFANPSRTEPVVRMYITTRIEQYNVTLNLNGPVDRLRTNYTSEPSLPPADIIHLLAFGNTSAEAASAPSQSAAMGAESVLAQGVGSQVAGRLENLTGISQLSIDPLATNGSGDPGAQIAIQERITGSLLFSFSTNVTTTQGQTVELQYDLNRRVSVTVLRDQNGGYGVDLRYHKVF